MSLVHHYVCNICREKFSGEGMGVALVFEAGADGKEGFYLTKELKRTENFHICNPCLRHLKALLAGMQP